MKKIGIACAGQGGDCLTAMSVFVYKEELWGDAEITWFADERYFDIFKFNPYLKVRQFPHGWQISEYDKATIYAERIAKDKADGKPDWEDWSLIKNADNRLNQEMKHLFETTSQFDEIYFPAPHQLSVEQRHGINYPNCSKKVFGVPMEYVWHPILYWSEEEKYNAQEFINTLPPLRKIVLVETFGGSSQSKITHDMIRDALDKCDEVWGQCNFIFVSHKYLNPQYGMETFPESILSRSVSAAHFTVRQCALLGHYCDLLLSVSSGVTCALSCYGNKNFPTLQYCGSAICGTKELANGECVQVFTDDNPKAEEQYFEQLNYLLSKYK